MNLRYFYNKFLYFWYKHTKKVFVHEKLRRQFFWEDFRESCQEDARFTEKRNNQEPGRIYGVVTSPKKLFYISSMCNNENGAVNRLQNWHRQNPGIKNTHSAVAQCSESQQPFFEFARQLLKTKKYLVISPKRKTKVKKLKGESK